jgi:hypothetical protein
MLFRCRILIFSFFVVGIFILSSCRTTRRVADGNFLLTKNELVFTQKTHVKELDQDEVSAIIKQRPNRKVAGLIPFHVSLHNIGNNGKDKKMRKWLMNIGEEPVLLDSVLTHTSAQQIHLFLKQRGFFLNEVTDTTIYKKKKAFVKYNITLNEPYRVRRIIYAIPDTNLFNPVLESSKNKTLIQTGTIYSDKTFEKERERMVYEMKDKGYYLFNREHIAFEIDSNLNQYRVDVKVVIKNPYNRQILSARADTMVEGLHKKYYIRNIYINPQYNARSEFQSSFDTVNVNKTYILYTKPYLFRPDVITRSIFISSGELYRQSKVEYSYNRIAELRSFRFINFRFEGSEISSSDSLDCFVNLTPSSRQSIGFDSEGTHRGGNLGIAGNIVYRNKNTFKGAEVFEFRIKGGLEAQQINTQVSEDNSSGSDLIERTPFNTVEYGAEASIYVPDLLLPGFLKRDPRFTKPRTNLNFSYNYQHRPDFQRTIANMNYRYSWSISDFHSLTINPLDLSVIRIEKDPLFEQRLKEIGNPLLINSYSNHLIPATRLSYTYSNQPVNRRRNFTFFRINLESAGHTMRALSPVLGLDTNAQGSYEIFGIRFAQYVKTDIDIRRFTVITENTEMVYRFFSGIGIAHSNLNVLPFEKSFFGGGANGMRAWRARSLGPGGLTDTLRRIDQIGDIQLEANVEYRFDMISFFEGAFFADAGNIWLLREDLQRPNAHFMPSTFISQVAIGAGFGLRLDFSFFLVRFDIATQIRDPALLEGERWVFQSKAGYNAMMKENAINKGLAVPLPYRPRLIFNLGIGYPF